MQRVFLYAYISMLFNLINKYNINIFCKDLHSHLAAPLSCSDDRLPFQASTGDATAGGGDFFGGWGGSCHVLFSMVAVAGGMAYCK